MKVIEAKYEILDRRGLTAAQKIEMAGRTAYKSEGKIDEDSALPFMEKMLENNHMPVIEFANIHIALECNMDVDEFDSKMIDFVGDGANLKYVTTAVNSDTEENRHILLISGTIRAVLEMINNGYPRSLSGSFMHSIVSLLSNGSQQFPIAMQQKDKSDLPVEVDSRIVAGIVRADSLMRMMEEVPEILEMHMMCAVRFTCNRAVSHELVRHRPLSILQESQRYCRYSADKFGNEVTFIKPKAFFACPGDFPNEPHFDDKYTEYYLWERACSIAEETYMMLLEKGNSPQAARTVLPNSCKTEVIMYATIAEWRHIFKMRVPASAEPSMRELTVPLFEEFFNDENKAKWE